MAVKPIPDGYNRVQPYLLVRDVPRQIDFLTKTFGAREIMRTTGGSGGTHAEVRIGDSVIMMGGDDSPGFTPMPSALYIYCEDVDAAFQRALAAGGTSLEEPANRPYGDRVAGVKDSAGNIWWIGTHVQDVAH
jgi:PhnB protein